MCAANATELGSDWTDFVTHAAVDVTSRRNAASDVREMFDLCVRRTAGRNFEFGSKAAVPPLMCHDKRYDARRTESAGVGMRVNLVVIIKHSGWLGALRHPARSGMSRRGRNA
jgi:hypothetical protein